jgi:hypothetical protein
MAKPSCGALISAFLLGATCLNVFAMALAGDCSARSGRQRVALLELYTSEGCSSCPPVDEWLSKLPAKGLASDRLVPLAFHVDYWNYLGWHDVFSQAKFTARQRRIAQINNVNFLYTPQLVLNGENYRRGFLWDNTSEKINEINRQTPLANVDLALSLSDTRQLHVKAKIVLPSGFESQDAQAYLTLYENNLSNAVKAGENNGRILHHDFVVRELAGPVSIDSQGATQIEETFNLQRDWKLQDTGVVAFVQNARSGEVLQALALAACR